jgi:hypothetical protein
MRLAITLRLPHLRQRSRLTKWLIGAPGLTPKRMRSRSEMTLLCRHDRQRIEIPCGGRGVICLWYIVPRTTMATFWRPRVGGQELEAKSWRPRVGGQKRKENAVCRASFRAEQSRGREGRQSHVTSWRGWRIKTILCPRKARFDWRDWGRWRPPRGRRTPRWRRDV